MLMSLLVHESPFCFLVIGCGSIGKRHLRNLQTLGAGQILAFDVRCDRRDEVELLFGVKVLEKIEDAWNGTLTQL